MNHQPIHLAISTFLPEPFEVIRPRNIVVRRLLGDRFLTINTDFEIEAVDSLGPALLSRKTIPFDLIRRNS